MVWAAATRGAAHTQNARAATFIILIVLIVVILEFTSTFKISSPVLGSSCCFCMVARWLPWYYSKSPRRYQSLVFQLFLRSSIDDPKGSSVHSRRRARCGDCVRQIDPLAHLAFFCF